MSSSVKKYQKENRSLLLMKVIAKVNQVEKKEEEPIMIAVELTKLFDKYLDQIKKCLNRHGFLTRVTNLKEIENKLKEEVEQYKDRCHKVKFLDLCKKLKKSNFEITAIGLDLKVKDQEERLEKFKSFKAMFKGILKELKLNLLKLQAKDPNKEIDIKGILGSLASLSIDLSY